MTPNDASLTAPYPLCLEGICDVFVEYVIPLSAFDKTMIQQMCASKWYHQISSHTDYDKQIEAVQAHYVSPSVEVQQVISELLWEHRTSFKALNRNVATLTSADLAHWQREDDPKFEQGHSQPDNEQLFESPQTQTHLPLAYPALRSPSADPLQQYPQHFELHETDASTSQPHSQQQPQHSQ